MRVRKVVKASATFASVMLLLASCTPTPIPGLSVEHGPIRGPGQFDIKIIVINATLTGRITCDNGVTITPSGPPEVLGEQEITPAILKVPQSFTEGTVTCFVPTSARGTFPFAIWVGPLELPKGPPPRIPLRLELSKTSILCKVPRQQVTLQLTMVNELSEPVTVMSIKSAHRLLIFAAASPAVPITLAPGEQKEVSLQFTCTGFGIVKHSLAELQLADGAVMIF